MIVSNDSIKRQLPLNLHMTLHWFRIQKSYIEVNIYKPFSEKAFGATFVLEDGVDENFDRKNVKFSI